MRKVKTLVSFVKLPVTAKIVFYRNVILKMTGNPHFLKPDVPLSEAGVAVDALENAYIASRDRSRTAIALMYETEKSADALFRLLAIYVDRIANGDATIILSSGFQPSDQPSPINKRPLAVTDGRISGSVKLMARAVPKAGSYIWQMSKGSIPDSEDGWVTFGYTMGTKYFFENLEVGVRYYFRVAAVTPSGTTDYTSPVMKVVI